MRTAGETLSSRLRTEIQQSSTLWDNGSGQDQSVNCYPCPEYIKPLLSFYKYLQPISVNGRSLRLNLPSTLICERQDGREETIWLRTDPHGNVTRESKTPSWRKKLFQELIASASGEGDEAKSPESVHDDTVIAVRTITHWKSASSNKSIVLTKRTFDAIVNPPSELSFCIQQYVRCRGSHVSIYRVMWSEQPNKCCAVNITNEYKYAEAPISAAEPEAFTATDSAAPVERISYERAMKELTPLSRFYCVSSTRDSKKKLQLPKIRGSPVADGVDAVQRVVQHVQIQLPGLRFRSMTVDFIKDAHGTWWFIRVMNFDAFYRIEIPQEVQQLQDSVTHIPDELRSKHFRQSILPAPVGPTENYTIPDCTLCGCSCGIKTPLRDELASLLKTHNVDSHDVLNALTEYSMNVTMAADTIYRLRQRGIVLPAWERAVRLICKTPGLPTEFIVCYLCYRVIEQQQRLNQVAAELHGMLCVIDDADSSVDGVEASIRLVTSEIKKNIYIPCDLGEIIPCAPPPPASAVSVRPEILLEQLHEFQAETCSLLNGSSPDYLHTLHQFSHLKGDDIDPTSTQMRLVFFFHELQDGGPDLAPTDFYLEYQVGQTISRLRFEGSKCHTPNRWQLCEVRMHYLFATVDAFNEYCMEKRLQIKMRTVEGDTFHGYTVLSFRPLITAAKRFGNSLFAETRTDYLLEIQTDLYGLLTLKLTLGLLVDPVPFSHVRDIVREHEFLKEAPQEIYWPPPSFCLIGLMVPTEWIGALMPSEYISVVPMKSRSSHHRGLALERSSVKRGGDPDSRRFTLDHHKSSRDLEVLRANHGSSRRLSLDLGDRNTPLSLVSASLPSIGNNTTKVLASVVMVIKRLVFRFASDITSISTALLGQLLRHASFVSIEEESITHKPWKCFAVYQLSRKYSVDHLLAGTKPILVPPLIFAAELILVLLKNRLLPEILKLSDLETLLSPFWLQNGPELVTIPKTSPHDQQLRIIWNRSLRRCQIASFHQAFEYPHDPELIIPQQEMNISTGATHETTFRTKVLALLLSDIFEEMESMDNGRIDIAELRSLAKCYLEPEIPEFTMPACVDPIDLREYLQLNQVSSLSQVLDQSQQRARNVVLRTLIGSEIMITVMERFDLMGDGEMGFEEYWILLSSAIQSQRNVFSAIKAEPTTTGFCLRHGRTELFAIDAVCRQCSMEFQDRVAQSPMANTVKSLSKRISQAIVPVPEPAAPIATDVDNDVSPEEPASNESQELDVSVAIDPSANLQEGSLGVLMEKLEAAEWHIMHRQESIDRNSLKETIMRRRSSLEKKNALSLAPTFRSQALPKQNTFTELAEFVEEAETRKRDHMVPPLFQRQDPGITIKQHRRTKKGRKKLRSATTPIAGTKLTMSASLSSLLHRELQGPSLDRGRHSSSTTELLKQVDRMATKRKQLDHVVLAELEDIKQRLAKANNTKHL